MAAYIGMHQGLLQGVIFGSIAFAVIAIGVLTYRRWVSRSENRHIVRGRDEERAERGADRGYGDPRSHGT